MADALIGYNSPIIILIQNRYNTIEENNLHSLFGAYTNHFWEDTLGYFGNSETYLFWIKPSFQTFFTYNAKGGKNYCYLNTKKIANSNYKWGIGFGGNNMEYYWIWLDYELL